MSTTKIYLEVPNDIHFKVKEIQLEKERSGDKKSNLKELYIEILREKLLDEKK